jgi:hypothetical protein
MTDTEPQLEERTCAKCGATDTEPHHVQYVAFNHPVSGMGMDLSVSKHVMCCAEDGCPICTVDVERARADGVDVAHMRDWLTNRPHEHLQVLFEQFNVESPDFNNVPGTEEEAPA